MKKTVFIGLLAVVLVFAGCGFEEFDKKTLDPPNSTQLYENQWASGTSGNSTYDYRNNSWVWVQWFRFTATSPVQYIHVNFNYSSISIQLYDSSGTALNKETTLSVNWNSPGFYTGYDSFNVTPGQTYYIIIRSYSSSYNLLQVAFNSSATAP